MKAALETMSGISIESVQMTGKQLLTAEITYPLTSSSLDKDDMVIKLFVKKCLVAFIVNDEKRLDSIEVSFSIISISSIF
jgi:hypothetical protein